ncbi:MAG: cytochrome C oxidase Cbb3 [Acidimicrobiia bacterium]|nr:cytochrome C oxidase Cbb3 [Acidimicrobiia bacterium]
MPTSALSVARPAFAGGASAAIATLVLAWAIAPAAMAEAQTQIVPEDRCDDPRPFSEPFSGPLWNGWGADVANTRFQSAASAGLSAADVPRLAVKWAYGFPNGHFASSQVTVAGGRLFLGAGPGAVYSIDADRGCTYWVFQTHHIVRTSISIGRIPGSEPARYAAYFGDLQSNVYAIDAETGSHLWTRRADTHSQARITGSPTLHAGRLYVPVTHLEEAVAASPAYECCTGRGHVVAYDVATGQEIWRTYMIDETPKPTRKNSAGTQMWGPAGAGVWNAPTVDVERGLLYVATGDAYTAPAAVESDAIVALDLKTGRKVWVKQLLGGDAWITGCADMRPDNPSPNCPDPLGPDFDFSQSAVFRRLASGKDVIAIFQKSGVVWGLDPSNRGEVLWQHELGVGDVYGAQFGSAADERVVYVASADPKKGAEVAGGIAALDMGTGRRMWYRRPPPRQCEGEPCIQAQAAALTAIPGVVFSASQNGVMRAYAAADGSIIWEHDTVREYETVNGLKARGGRIDGPGPVVVNGTVYFHSGYATTRGGVPGNVLLAFAAR